jgi:hypothetical protein
LERKEKEYNVTLEINPIDTFSHVITTMILYIHLLIEITFSY